MSGLQLQEEEEPWQTSLPGWQAGDSQYRQRVICSRCQRQWAVFPPQTEGQALRCPTRRQQELSPFNGDAYDDEEKDVGPCSQQTDRKVSKIILYPEPKMPEEQFNICTSSGALPRLYSTLP